MTSSLRPDEWVIAQYLTGRASEEERAEVEAWLAVDAKAAQVIGVMRDSKAQNISITAQRDAWDAIGIKAHRRDASCVRPSGCTESRTHEVSLRRAYSAYRYLGIIAVIAIAVFSIKYISGFNKPTTQSYTTSRAERVTVRLSDNSSITLAPETKLTVTQSSQSIGVQLDGEAVFNVLSNNQKAFVVHAGNSATRVLGTTFGVRKYSSDNEVQIAVSNGKVSVNSVVVSAGAVGRVRSDGSTYLRSDVNAVQLLAWTNGQLVFRDTPLSEVAAQLSRWYDVDVVLDDPALGSLPLTITVRNDRLSDVVQTIARAAGLKVRQVGRTVTISP